MTVVALAWASMLSGQPARTVGAAAMKTFPSLPGTLTEFLLLDAEISGVTHRLALANAALCSHRVLATGLVLATQQEFGGEARAALRAVAGGRPMVTGSVGISASADLHFGDVVVAMDGVPTLRAEAAGQSFDATRQAYAQLDRASGDGRVRIDYLRGERAGSATLLAVPACAIRSQLKTSGLFNASTDGQWIEVTSAVAEFVTSTDELAAIVGHEFAHVVRSDRAPDHSWPRASARNRERLADRLGIYLAARAGYRADLGASVFRRFGKRQGMLHWLDLTHPGFVERSRAVEQEAVAIDQQGRAGQGIIVPPALLR